VNADGGRLSPIIHDARREANDSIAGTLYQAWRAVHEWIQLGEDEELYLEGAEDIDSLRKGEATLIQLRRTTASVSLNSAKILEGIGHYWTHARNNPDRRVRYRYSTIAGVAKEQGQPFDDDRPGLELWRLARTADDASVWRPIVGRISRVLSRDQRLPKDLREFLSTSSVDDIRQLLFVPVEFDTWASDIEQVKRDVERAVVRYGRPMGVAPVSSLRAIPALLQRVLEASADPRDRRLQFVDFATVFSVATSYPVPPDRLIVGETQTGERVLLAQEDVLTSLPPMTPHYFRRGAVIIILGERLSTSRAAFIIGSSGKGKSQVALDHASLAGGHWRLLDLRDCDTAEIERRLRSARASLLRAHDIPNVIIEDMNIRGDSTRAVRALSDLLTLVREAGAQLVVTSYSAPTRPMFDALRLSENDVLSIPDFSEEEIRALLIERGAPTERSLPLAKAVWLQSDGGHPTFVDVRAEYLRRHHFPELSVNDVLQTPDDIVGERERVRRFIAVLDQQEQSLLYRISLSLGPLLREHLVKVGAAEIPPDGVVRHPGAILDRLIGPWLELQSSGRLRVSPLIKDAAIRATDTDWVKAAHEALGHALLAVQPVDVRDAVNALMHAIAAEDQPTVLRVLIGFVMEQDPAFWRSLSQAASWFSAIGIDVAPIPALQGALVVTFLRAAQYRIANVTQDGDIARRIVEHFDREITDADALATKLRLVFYGTVMARPAESGAVMMTRAFSFLSSADDVANDDPKTFQEVMNGLGVSGPEDKDLLRWAGSLVFAATKTTEDLRAIVTELEDRGEAFARRFLGWLNDTTIAWRGVVASVIVSERNSEEPNFAALIDVLQRISRLAARSELQQLAVDAIASAASVAAEQKDDPAGADSIIATAENELGATARLIRARAIARHAAGSWEEALTLFMRSFQELQREADDPELPLDMRLAANAAGNIGQFRRAQSLLEDAADLLVSSVQPSMAAGLLMDGAYAAWRDGRDDDALRLATASVRRLAALEVRNDDERLQNTARRALYVVLLMMERPASDLHNDDPIPTIGFASNPDLLPDTVAPIPMGILFANLGFFEQRVTGGSSIVETAGDIMKASGPLGAGVEVFLRLNAVARSGDLDKIVAALHDLHESAAAISVQHGQVPEFGSTDLQYIAIALIAVSAKSRLTSDILLRLVADTERYGFTHVSRWLVKGVNFFSDRQAAVEALEADAGEMRLLAAILVPALSNIGASVLFLAQQSQIALLGGTKSATPIVDVVLSAAQSMWRAALSRPALFPGASTTAIETLASSLESTGSSREQLLTIFRAAETASQLRLFPSVEALLGGR
jgi:hypothetical protein